MNQPATGVSAILRRLATSAQGHLLAVDIATDVELDAWYAELVPPEGATVTAGPDTTVEKQGQAVKLKPTSGHVTPPGTAGGKAHATVRAAVSGTQQAPKAIRVHTTPSGSAHDTQKQQQGKQGGYATFDGVFVQTKRGQLVAATDQSWPGSSSTVTDPNKFTTGHGGGFGGGGGGGGQFSCDLFVDFQNQTVTHKVGSDAGGGGGSGGGYGGGSEYQQNNHQNQG